MIIPKEKIPAFRGEFGFLSNMYELQNPIDYNGIYFKTVEHAFVASKTDDIEIQKHIATIPEPNEAKKYGKSIKLRDNWENLKINIMMELVYKKFSYNPKLAQKLLNIDGDIVERNYWHDTFWGVCNGVGENWLGNILIGVRATIREENKQNQ